MAHLMGVMGTTVALQRHPSLNLLAEEAQLI
jgi:hypothetical protein